MKGLLFVPQMAVAACEGRKTLTRRVVVPQPDAEGIADDVDPPEYGRKWQDTSGKIYRCDYQPGELRCLLTTWATHKAEDHRKPTQISFEQARAYFWHAGLGTPKPAWAGKSRPGRFLPNHLRPLMPVFKIYGVRAERVQDITEADAQAEGVARNECNEPWTPDDGWIKYPLDKNLEDFPAFTAKESFQTLWDSINAPRGYGWSVNPWVWVVGFRRITP